MNAFTTFVSVALLIVSSIRALTITSPTNGASVLRGSAFSLLINNAVSETATSAATVVFSSSFGTFTGTYVVGTAYSVILPLNMAGITTITASATSAATAISSINLLTYNPYIPCYNPCYNPCVRPCEPRRPSSCHIPRTSCNIPRPRTSCRIRDENDASSVEEVNFSESEQAIDDSKEITFELNTEQLLEQSQAQAQEAIGA